jgi:hypothetical protein
MVSEGLRPHAAPLLDAMLADAEQRTRLITRYVRGELDGDLLIAFEIRLLDDSALLADTELESALRKGMRALTPRELGTGAWRFVPAGLRLAKPPSMVSLSALAASLVVGVALGIWWRSAALGSGAFTPATGMTSARVLQVDVLRGADDAAPMPQLVVPTGQGRAVVRLPAPNEPGPFRVRLLGPSSELARLESVLPDDTGLISLDTDLTMLGRAQRLVVDSPRGADWVQGLEIALVTAGIEIR